MAKSKEDDKNSLFLLTNPGIVGLAIVFLCSGKHFGNLTCYFFGCFIIVMGVVECIMVLYKNKQSYSSLFKECGLVNKQDITPALLNASENAIGPLYIFDIPDGLCYNSFVAQTEKFSAHFGYPVKFFKLRENRVQLQIQTTFLRDLYSANFKAEPFTSLGYMQFAIGVKVTPEGFEDVIIDYSKVESHILISGGSGAGKSTLLRLLYSQIILQGFTLHVMDAKLNEIGIFRDYPNLIVSSDPSNVLTQILSLADIMAERNYLFFLHRVVNIKQFNKKFPKYKMTPIFVVVDEFSPYRKNTKVKEALGQLLSIGRTAGIHVILSTQRIDSESMGDLKTNLGTRFSMKAETKADSGIAMGQGDSRAYSIVNAGRLYMKYGKETDTEVQVFNISTEDCICAIKPKLTGHFLYTLYQSDYELDFITGLPKEKRALPAIPVSDNPLAAYRGRSEVEISAKERDLDEAEANLLAQQTTSDLKPNDSPTIEDTLGVADEMASQLTVNTKTKRQVFGRGKS